MWTWAWTAIWTVLAFVLLLVHADTILAFAAEQLDQRRTHRLRLEQERTKQALIAHQRDEVVWRQLGSSATTSNEVTQPLPRMRSADEERTS